MPVRMKETNFVQECYMSAKGVIYEKALKPVKGRWAVQGEVLILHV